jgi:hypothetical protein
VIVGCWLVQPSVTVPEKPFELRISGKMAVSPGCTVAVVVVPGAGVSETTAPEPVSVTVCVPFEALLVMLTEALNVFTEVGVKVTLIVQLAFGWTEVSMHVVPAKLKLPGFVPPSEELLMLKGARPVLVTVTVWGRLVVFGAMPPKLMEFVLSEIVGTAPVPCSVIT